MIAISVEMKCSSKPAEHRAVNMHVAEGLLYVHAVDGKQYIYPLINIYRIVEYSVDK